MTSRKGGYIIIDLTSTTLVDDLEVALSFGKPVLVYNANNEANFYTLSYDDDNDLYILNGAKDSFSVDDDGDITPIIAEKLYSHKIATRFNLTISEETKQMQGSIFLVSNNSEKYTTSSLPNNDSTIVNYIAMAITGFKTISAELIWTSTGLGFRALLLDGSNNPVYINETIASSNLTLFNDVVSEF